jgi:hypothetical protein
VDLFSWVVLKRVDDHSVNLVWRELPELSSESFGKGEVGNDIAHVDIK